MLGDAQRDPDDLFDLPTDRGSHVNVWVSTRIPGLHTIGQLGGGGSGVNVQPRRP